MMRSQLVEHPVVEPYNWPLAVQDLAQLLSQPVPDWLASGPYPFVSPHASSLLPLLSECEPLQLASVDIGADSQSISIRDVFDLVLSTTADLRDLKGRVDRGEPRQMSPLWSSLVQGLSHACFKEASTL